MAFEEFKMQCLLLGFTLDIGVWSRISVYINVKEINIPKDFPKDALMSCMKYYILDAVRVNTYEDVINQLNVYIDLAESI